MRFPLFARMIPAACALIAMCSATARAVEPVTLNWLGNAPPAVSQGVSWGVPWPRGAVRPDEPLALTAGDGKSIPVQSWPLAFWPDGSLKWSGHSIAAAAGLAGPFKLAPGAAAPVGAVKAVDNAASIDIDTGFLRARINKTGANLFESLSIGERVVAKYGHLIAQREDRSQQDKGIVRIESFISQVASVTLEQSGPIRAVVRVEGMHQLANPAADAPVNAWLPFTVRLYFTSGQGGIRIVHSFIYDRDGGKDFIKGIGLSFSVPMVEAAYNRHIRFAGDRDDGRAANTGEGVWVQPVQLLPGYRNTPNAAQYAQHLAGQRMAPMSGAAVESVPVWNDFRLSQDGPDSFSIDKRTTAKSSWLHVNSGKRSLGLALVGDVSGGIAVGVKHFWQKYPSEIEIRNAASDTAEMKVWLWSPDAPAMDLRHYDTVGHGLQTNYEDWKEGWDSPLGVANTADLTLWAFDAIPSNAALAKMARNSDAQPLLIATPAYYHQVAAFGTWSLPDRSSPAKKWIEDQLDYLYAFYQQQVEERHWYGFWDFGDVMHNYDFGRHEWRYDVGGWAWTNTELMPDMYLYYMFLRSGRADIFRMAEAMTRNTSEVSVHHIGFFAPLGSRHNVNHWGDGAKQPRICGTAGKRFYYYLSTDERTGDLMREQLTADATYLKIKRIDPRTPATSDTAAFGTDWTAYAMSWMTEWERTGKPEYRDKLTASMKSLVISPTQLAGGGGYDVKTGTFTNARGNGPGYFDMIFGGPEILSEAKTMVDMPDFWAGWANANAALSATGGNDMTAPRAAAYAAFVHKDPAMGRRAWDALIGNGMTRPLPQPQLYSGPDVLRPVHDPVFLGASVGWQLHGPASVQWALNAIETLELAKEYLPAWEDAHAGDK